MIVARPVFPPKHDASYEDITAEEVYDLVKDIKDPEHPSMTYQDLKVVSIEDIKVCDQSNFIHVIYTPTTPDCSMGSILGLNIKIKLMRCLPSRFTIEVICKEGAHVNGIELNKQLNDKERALAAMDNPSIMGVVNRSIQ